MALSRDMGGGQVIRPFRTFDHLVGLAAKLRRRCDYLAALPDIVQGAVGFHWAIDH